MKNFSWGTKKIYLRCEKNLFGVRRKLFGVRKKFIWGTQTIYLGYAKNLFGVRKKFI